MIFLSSFPRSGNTFLRNILFEVYGLESGEFHLNAAHALDDNLTAYPVVKTHELPSKLNEFDPNIPAIYLVRDGRDSVCSMAHHRSDLVSPGSDYVKNLKTAIIAAKGSFFGGWSRNAEDWLERADLVIRFEDLIRDPIGTVEKIRKVYALPKPVVENLPNFKTQKYGIPKYGHGMNPNASEEEKIEKSGKFFRQGKTGGWKEDMPDYLHDLFWSYHGETMEKFGYSRSGELLDLNPEFDHVLQAKLGIEANNKPSKKYKVLIEADKIVSPDNDGVKRYQVELLKALLPVVENPGSNWEIDLFMHGNIKSLLDCRDVVLQSFLLNQTKRNIATRISNMLLTAERNLVAMIPKSFVRFLAEKEITIFHTIHRLLRRVLISPIRFIRNRGLKEETTTPQIPGEGAGDKFDTYDLVHIPLQQHYAPFQKTQTKTVITINDLTHLHLSDHHTEANISHADEGMKFAIDRQAHLIAVSQSTKNDILDSTPISEGKVHLIYIQLQNQWRRSPHCQRKIQDQFRRALHCLFVDPGAKKKPTEYHQRLHSIETGKPRYKPEVGDRR